MSKYVVLKLYLLNVVLTLHTTFWGFAMVGQSKHKSSILYKS